MLRALNRNLPLPREHGAWAMVLVPAVVGLARGSAAAWEWGALLVALLGVFVAQDVLVQRFTRDRAVPGWRAFLVSAGVAAAGGVPLLVAGHWELLWLVAGSLVYLVAHVARIRKAGPRAHRHLAFETLTVAVLCCSGVAGAMVAGSPPVEWSWVWGAAAVMFVGSTFHVRALLRARLARKRGPFQAGRLAVESLVLHAAVGAAVVANTIVGGSSWLWLAFAPLVVRAFAAPALLRKGDPSLKAAGLSELAFTSLWAGGMVLAT